MLSFRTEIKPERAKFAISRYEAVLSMGSCFAERVGQRLLAAGHRLCLNPFGTTYNPLSLSRGLLDLLQGRNWTQADLVWREGHWHSWAHHGQFSGSEAFEVLAQIAEQAERARAFVDKTSVLMLTLGTAYVYERQGEVVNNCHRFPAAEFERRRLSVSECVEALSEALLAFKKHRPALKVVLTLSPIRHLRDGATENQRSKATLLLALHELQERQPDWIAYFPAYELLLDDLRDYRFYASDYVHPSEVAEDYIFQHFERCFLLEEEAALRKLWAKFQQALAHRPLQGGAAYLQFLEQQQAKLKQAAQMYPKEDFSALHANFIKKIKDL